MTLSELSTNARVVPIDGADVSQGRTLQQHTSLPSQRQLLVRLNTSKEEYKVSVVYYRSGYSPNDYPSEIEWDVRVMIENSRAIKCPSIGYQLAGTKAIQAALYLPNVLEKYLTKDDSIKIRQCFAAQYSMIDFRNGDEVTKMAVENLFVILRVLFRLCFDAKDFPITTKHSIFTEWEIRSVAFYQ
jgi:hypothetical protein